MSYADVVLADSPIGYFHLDETSGVDAIDATGGASGTYLGNFKLRQPGAFADSGTSVGFDGSNGGVSLAKRFDFTGTMAYSLEAWIQPGTFDGTFHEIGSRWAQPPDRAGFTWYQQNAGFGFERDGSGGELQVPDSSTFVENAWTYVVATYDGTTMAIYVNGRRQAAMLATYSTPEVNLATMIGAANGDPRSATFLGNIDEYAIYDHALSADSVAAHYAAAQPNP